jgi:hypothetical protein
MSKMNWNRPNKGYEAEPWRKKQYKPELYERKLKPRSNKQINLWGCETHQAEVRLVKYSSVQPVLWCVDCNKHLKTLSREDYAVYKLLTSK